MDGLWFRFGGKPWVLYLIALRACHERAAVFLDPVIIEGKEGFHKWEQAVETIPFGEAPDRRLTCGQTRADDGPIFAQGGDAAYPGNDHAAVQAMPPFTASTWRVI